VTTSETVTTNLAVPERALAIGAHPDDIEFGCGATLAKWAAAGCSVTLLVLTDGSKGTWNRDDDPSGLVAIRKAEQRNAAAALGAHGVEFLDRVDGELVDGRPEQAAVCQVIRTYRPDVVLGHDPWKRYRIHPDHRHAGWLTLDAIVAARDPHFFPDQPVAVHRPSRVLLFEAEEVDHLEAVDGWIDTKIAALLEHRSQWRSTMSIDDDDDDDGAGRDAFAARVRDTATRAAEHTGLIAAEAFKRLDDV
jgi:LmbE family N-acetylglucosaminyl deacetylase